MKKSILFVSLLLSSTLTLAADQAAAVRCCHAGVAVDQLAVSPDQVLVKIPARCAATGFGQFQEQRVGIFAGDHRLLKHRELHAVGVVAKVGNVLAFARFLLAKVVRRKAQHHQALGAVVGVQLFQPFVLGREAAVTRCVDYQQHLACVLADFLGGVVLQALEGFLQQSRAGRRRLPPALMMYSATCRTSATSE